MLTSLCVLMLRLPPTQKKMFHNNLIKFIVNKITYMWIITVLYLPNLLPIFPWVNQIMNEHVLKNVLRAN